MDLPVPGRGFSADPRGPGGLELVGIGEIWVFAGFRGEYGVFSVFEMIPPHPLKQEPGVLY